MKTFGEYARERVRKAGKSQKTLAGKLGVSPAYVSQIFTGKKNPPDLGRARNRLQLRIWAEFLDAAEEDILEVIRYQLHRVPPRPTPRFGRMRNLLLTALDPGQVDLSEEIRALELHPAESLAVQALVQIYLLLHESEPFENRGYGPVRFRDLCMELRGNREFIESELVDFFGNLSLSWIWDLEAGDVRFSSTSPDIERALKRLEEMAEPGSRVGYRRTVPVVGHVSAGEGFAFTDGGYPAGEGFDQVELPPGVDPGLAQRLYCVRVRGDSLREFINEGALLFIKPESWEEIKDGDLVIFKDTGEKRAFVKKVEFAGSNLILRSMNPQYRNIVLRKSELLLLERVIAILF
jgi:phage repressor protein C with HTH and peptisase S24 domain/transcriptional regulator with XRE-family HTH domain